MLPLILKTSPNYLPPTKNCPLTQMVYHLARIVPPKWYTIYQQFPPPTLPWCPVMINATY